MNNTFIIRRIDDLGRIVIPKEVRRELHLNAGDQLAITVRGSDEISMRKIEEPDLSIKKTEFGEEVLVNKKGEILCAKPQITCEDMAKALGVSFSREE